MICRHDDAYPMGLTAFERESDIPHVIFGRGDRSVLAEAAAGRAIALVGARRASADVRQVESQNWLMLMGARNVRTTQLSLHAMASLEPLTLKDIGSPQTFQSGETFQGEPLRDHQHPHDLFMGLGATWAGAAPQGLTWSLTGAVVGEPTLGPTAFMHRVSSEGNPTAPLAHHTLDSTISVATPCPLKICPSTRIRTATEPCASSPGVTASM